MGTALSLRDISKSFDGRPALADVSLDIEWGKVHALLGENGAGKSTLMNIAAGLYAQDEGRVFFGDTELTDNDPRHAKSLGIGMVHQHFKLVFPFTVAENVLLANPKGGYGRGLAETKRQIVEQSGKLGFALDPDAPVDSLSVAEQQRAEIIKVLLGGARLIILDEPTAVLTDEEAQALLSTMRVLAGQGNAVILVTHKLHEVPAYTDVVTVMRGGRKIETIASKEATPADLTKMMVGSALAEIKHRPATEHGVVLEVQDATLGRADGAGALNGLSMQVRGGEIYGVAGVGGNGQTELAAALIGLKSLESGTILMEGDNVTAADTRTLRRRGVAFVPAERMAYGLAEDMSVASNYAIAGVDRGEFGGPLWTRQGRIAATTQTAISQFEIAGAAPTTRAGLLSGGNAQKLVLARELREDARLLVVHSPTRGLDVRACAAVHRILMEARDRGAAIVLISEDLDEIFKISDRIGVINRGRIVGEFDAPADRHEVGALMVGHA
ncbi:ABC transporter ATP-binding protein [Microbaculum marinum]|uniref:ABC transporter ATP-binding protein n=1 Tax=Microbaculum marinum TaxID=1764581 RepID=A0AAW9S294_9HYPH